MAKRSPAKQTPKPVPDLATVMNRLRKLGTKKTRDGMSRYGLPSDKALGVTVADITKLAKEVGKSHALALALWDTDVYEARMLTAFVDELDKVTPEQMDRCCRDFDSWGIVDTMCFKLWDQSPHAWTMVKRWVTRKPEFEKRAAFVMIACTSAHNKTTTDATFREGLRLIERESTDDRNFVKKGVLWALRGVGRRNTGLHAQSLALSKKLAASADRTARWIGKEALKDLSKFRPK